jgi:hypothetical protein
MRSFVLFFPLFVSTALASLLDSEEPVTLDTAEFSRIWQDVKSGQTAPSLPAGDSWSAAMLAENAELARVLLLVWLQQQNPRIPMAANARVYADAVALHFRALAGQPTACAAIAAAYRAGHLGGLFLPPAEQKARWFEQRALIQENLPQ